MKLPIPGKIDEFFSSAPPGKSQSSWRLAETEAAYLLECLHNFRDAVLADDTNAEEEGPDEEDVDDDTDTDSEGEGGPMSEQEDSETDDYE